ncbi:ANTH-domain-containing protein [Metschnikowia bicuspidata var. bicuspidata NRRL YB-4993]|uniref:ANTH-domain-containing protein n=1 Tax=Metschnikowia bicuspidata var. bicuspidata NRRL YB-4993 TaxID=869754 RepID=A0A1A0HE83_9ASCO|nr:ANTH-domain-containing protein [Metschnikowia bicuspidata var. bicuspidata NRRL YB-4993]OBA22213.1 ANTH-domain-containing protein [Metschnikowia bicuspidata var. bicuspidata NRRL YB-4993]
MSRAEVDLQISVRKACNNEEVPPKRKHVRSCIVYTWDHKNSRAFWNAVKIQPLQSSEIQLFKALIMIHKVLQEGHPNTLKDGYRNRDFLYSLSTVFPSTSNYGLLINQYDRFLLQKLDFHRSNHGFNGIFEYEEYISLRTVNDPNEGYESILQLMDLQDLINDLQKHIFATVHQSPNNLCKVSALVPLISESYGIYKFLVSMLRAMFQQLGDDDALSALFDRFSSQHFVLRDFYTDCQAIKFLTSLITIPRIAASVPNMKSDEESQRMLTFVESQNDLESSQSGQASGSLENLDVPSLVSLLSAQKTEAIDQHRQLQQQQYELEAQRQQQLEEQVRRQQLFEQQMREQEQKRIQEQQFLRQQQTQNNQLRVSELEQDLLMFKAQFDNDQALLQQYDSRVKSIETELLNINQTAAQQIATKDEQLNMANEQISNWSKKYESLAMLYSQLRLEHLNLLAKFKKIQQKISSAQESILKKEKYEKDLKSKNLELADIIRERDRARLDVDRVKASKDLEIEHLQTQIRELTSQAQEYSTKNSLVLSEKINLYKEQVEQLRSDLIDREEQLASLGDLSLIKENLKEKEIDLEITQESLDSALRQLALAKLSTNADQLVNLLDVILANSVRRVQDSKYELLSPMQAGNSIATPEYLLSFLDLCSDTATNFSQAFNDLMADGDESTDDSAYAQVILTSSELTSALNDFMLNLKGLSKNITSDEGEELANQTTSVLSGAESLFLNLASDSINDLISIEDKIDFVIDCNLLFQQLLQTASSLIDTLRGTHELDLTKKENIEDVVEDKFSETADAVENASTFLRNLLSQIGEGKDFEVHESILGAALAITKAVSVLIAAATESQIEIVRRNKGEISRRDFYKKNSRWTEGLISASKAVAGTTNILIQTANGILKDENVHEQLIVACNEVAASTAQLVAASRVKANFVSKTQDKLETSSKTVNSACKSLVSEVQKLIRTDKSTEDTLDLTKLTPYEGKTLEMQQQVEILQLENSLLAARKRLTEIRKHGYADDQFEDGS